MVRLLTHGMNPQAALDAPRWKLNGGISVDLEACASPELRAGLIALGHEIDAVADSYMDFGAGQIILRTDGGYAAGVRSAPRRPGRGLLACGLNPRRADRSNARPSAPPTAPRRSPRSGDRRCTP